MRCSTIAPYRCNNDVNRSAVVPLSQSIMLDIFPPAQRGQAMAFWVMGVVLGPVLGPTLGGYLTDFYNWRCDRIWPVSHFASPPRASVRHLPTNSTRSVGMLAVLCGLGFYLFLVHLFVGVWSSALWLLAAAYLLATFVPY